MSGRFRLAQISDTQVRADDGGAAVAQMKRAIGQAAEYGADVILLTGDLVNDAREDEYVALAEALTDPPAPLYLMPGNHDDRGLLRRFFPHHGYLPREGALQFTVEDFPVRIVALDDVVPGETHGLLRRSGAEWLESALSVERGKPTIVALHHPPFLTHDLLFDKIGLLDAEEFATVVARHRQVLRVICGHHHRIAVGQAAHAPVIVAPSSSWTYGLGMNEGQQLAPRTSEQSGWVLHAWKAAGGVATHFMGHNGKTQLTTNHGYHIFLQTDVLWNNGFYLSSGLDYQKRYSAISYEGLLVTNTLEPDQIIKIEKNLLTGMESDNAWK